MSLTDAISGRRPKPANDAPPPKPRQPLNGESRARKYALAALDSECSDLRSTPEGERNDRLNQAAFSLGQLVGAGELSDGEVWEALRDAARACGLAAGETEATIASGLSAGRAEPRRIPEPEPRQSKRTNGATSTEPPAVDDWQPADADAPDSPDAPVVEAGPAPGQRPSAIADVIAEWREQGPLIHEPVGLVALDELTGGGPVYGTRWYLAGAPDAGKTALLVQIAHVYAGRGIAVGLLAVDEDAGDLVTRLAQRSGWSRHHCEARDNAVLGDILETLDPLPIRFYDASWTVESAAANLASFAATRAAQAPEAHPYGPRAMLGIDSIQTVTCAGEMAALAGGRAMSTTEAVTARSAAIRAVATRHRLIALATSELGRGAYASGNAAERTSTLAASKWSGAIEYSARVLLGLRNVAGETDLIDIEFAKNKHGPTSERVYLRIDRRSQTLTETSYDAPAADAETERDERGRAQVLSDAAAVAALLAEQPGLGVVALRGALRARLGRCSNERAEAALARLGSGVARAVVKRGAHELHLDGAHVPAEVLARCAEHERQTIESARLPVRSGGLDDG